MQNAELGPGAGDGFPVMALSGLGQPELDVLGIPCSTESPVLADSGKPWLLVMFGNSRCPACVHALENAVAYEKRAAEDGSMSGLGFLGICVMDTEADCRKFVASRNATFPFLADADGVNFEKLGQTGVPLAYLLQKVGTGYRIVQVRSDFSGGATRFYREMRSFVQGQ